MTIPALLMLTDARLPTGGHAHSGGLEAAVAAGIVTDEQGLIAFLTGRLATAGEVAAAFAAAACRMAGDPGELDRLDEELNARTPSLAIRTASYRLGAGLLRVARGCWPDPRLNDLCRAHHPIALGVIGAVAELEPRECALAAAYDAVGSPATAAVRLLGLDPFAVQAGIAELLPMLETIANRAAEPVAPSDLPSLTGIALEIGSQHHAAQEVRLFAS